jgi:hypothetical protein
MNEKWARVVCAINQRTDSSNGFARAVVTVQLLAAEVLADLDTDRDSSSNGRSPVAVSDQALQERWSRPVHIASFSAKSDRTQYRDAISRAWPA